MQKQPKWRFNPREIIIFETGTFENYEVPWNNISDPSETKIESGEIERSYDLRGVGLG